MFSVNEILKSEQFQKQIPPKLKHIVKKVNREKELRKDSRKTENPKNHKKDAA